MNIVNKSIRSCVWRNKRATSWTRDAGGVGPRDITSVIAQQRNNDHRPPRWQMTYYATEDGYTASIASTNTNLRSSHRKGDDTNGDDLDEPDDDDDDEGQVVEVRVVVVRALCKSLTISACWINAPCTRRISACRRYALSRSRSRDIWLFIVRFILCAWRANSDIQSSNSWYVERARSSASSLSRCSSKLEGDALCVWDDDGLEEGAYDDEE